MKTIGFLLFVFWIAFVPLSIPLTLAFLVMAVPFKLVRVCMK